MRCVLALGFLACFFVPNAIGADTDNPFHKAKVGDWAEYRMTAPNCEGKTKMTIVTASDKEVVYQVEATFTAFGQEQTAPVQKITVDLSQPYDAISAANMKQMGVTMEKVAEGTEKLKIGDKELDTHWTKSKYTSTAGGVTVVSEYKMWFCKDVSVSGLVRMDSTVGTIVTRVELTAWGSK
jgi:hypothetical protein